MDFNLGVGIPIIGDYSDVPSVIDVDFTRDPTGGGNNEDGKGSNFLNMFLEEIMSDPDIFSSDSTGRTTRPSQPSRSGSSVSAAKNDSGDMLLAAIKAFATPESLI